MSVSYNAKEDRLSASCSAQGHVWNTDSSFEFKRCAVTFRRHATGRLPEFAQEHGLDGACGSIQISSQLESETFEYHSEVISPPPIEITIVLDDRNYDLTNQLLRACNAIDREASLSLRFSHRNFTKQWVDLGEIDLIKKTRFPIISFELGTTRKPNRTVYRPRLACSSVATTFLTFTATNSALQTYLWNSVFSISSITLTGNLQSKQLDVSSDNETIEIKEYEQDSGWNPGYAAEAFPGVVMVSKGEDYTHCSVTLYATKVALAQLAGLLMGMSKGDTIRFGVSLIADTLPLQSGEQKEFDVTSYTPELLKCYS